jgi:hypothetical protein
MSIDSIGDSHGSHSSHGGYVSGGGKSSSGEGGGNWKGSGGSGGGESGGRFYPCLTGIRFPKSPNAQDRAGYSFPCDDKDISNTIASYIGRDHSGGSSNSGDEGYGSSGGDYRHEGGSSNIRSKEYIKVNADGSVAYPTNRGSQEFYDNYWRGANTLAYKRDYPIPNGEYGSPLTRTAFKIREAESRVNNGISTRDAIEAEINSIIKRLNSEQQKYIPLALQSQIDNAIQEMSIGKAEIEIGYNEYMRGVGGTLNTGGWDHIVHWWQIHEPIISGLEKLNYALEQIKLAETIAIGNKDATELAEVERIRQEQEAAEKAVKDAEAKADAEKASNEIQKEPARKDHENAAIKKLYENIAMEQTIKDAIAEFKDRNAEIYYDYGISIMLDKGEDYAATKISAFLLMKTPWPLTKALGVGIWAFEQIKQCNMNENIEIKRQDAATKLEQDQQTFYNTLTQEQIELYPHLVKNIHHE